MENDGEDVDKKQKKLPYKCDFCDKAFGFYCRLSAHRRRHTGEKPFPCEICHKRFASVATRNIHRKLHLDVEDQEKRLLFQCEFCFKKFDFQCRLDVHRRIHTGEKPFPCEICEKKFTDKRALNVHKKLKHGVIFNSIFLKGIPHECESCDKAFMYKRQLIIHQQSHSLDKPFSCRFCLQHFTRREALEIHKRIHVGGKPYQCDVCYKQFALEEELNVHGKAHEPEEKTIINKYSPEKNYKCEFCDKPFVYESRLRLHRTVHTRPYVCTICERRFARRYVLRRHMKTHGIDWPPSKTNKLRFRCEICKATFSSSQDLNAHKLLHSGKVLVDDMSFLKTTSLKTSDTHSTDKLKPRLSTHSILIERLTASYNCETCGVPFASMYEKQAHKEFCRKTLFDDESSVHDDHKTIKQQDFESGNKVIIEKITSSYDCEVCNASFISHVELKCHQESHFAEESFLNDDYFLKNELNINMQKKSQVFNNEVVAAKISSTSDSEICGQIFDSEDNSNEDFKKYLSFENDENIDLAIEKNVSDCVRTVVIEHVIPIYKCNVCEIMFKSQTEVDDHQNIHLDTKSSFYEKKLATHLLESDKSIIIEKLHPLYRCPLCQKILESNDDLIAHKESHTTSTHSLSLKSDEMNPDTRSNTKVDSSVIIERITLPSLRCKKEDHQLTHKEALQYDIFSSGTSNFDYEIDEPLPKTDHDDPDSFLIEPEVKLYIQNLNNGMVLQSAKQEMDGIESCNSKPFSCELCENRFVNKQDYNLHKKTHGDQKPFACDICPKRYWNRWNLKTHKLRHISAIRMHADNNLNHLYECEFCKKPFTWLNELNMHRKIHTGEKSFSCEICLRRFSRKDQLNLHRKLHLGLRPFSCLTCHRQYSKKEHLVLHRKLLHSDEKSVNNSTKKSCAYKCKFCTRVFYSQYQLQVHQRVHTGEKPYMCDLCDKRFTRKWNLNLHQTLHATKMQPLDTESSSKHMTFNNSSTPKSTHFKKDFKCRKCEASFISEYLLKNHQQIHKYNNCFFTCIICSKPYTTQTLLLHHSKNHIENPYFCVRCGKSYNLASKLAKHIKMQHTKKAFSCHLCNRSFDKQKYLKAHRKIHQLNRSFACPYCERVFPYESLVNAHKKVHLQSRNFKCETCYKRFLSISALTRHKQIHNNRKTYTCDYCQKKFVTKNAFEVHVKTHQGMKPYPCNMCDKQYLYFSGLTYHMSSHTGHKPYHCPMCPMKFPERGGLNRHIKSHTGEKSYSCKKCHKYFSRKTTLKHHEKSVKCVKS